MSLWYNALYFSNFMNKFSFRVYTYDPCLFYIWLIFFKLYEQILFQSVHIRSMLLLHLAYIFQTLWTNYLSECTHTIHASFTFGLYFSNFMNKFSFRVYTYDPCFFYIWLIFFKLYEQILFQSVHIRSMLLLHLAYIFQTLWTNSLSECTHTIHASFTFGLYFSNFMNKFSFRVYTYDPCFFYIWLIFFKLYEQILFQSVHIRSMLLLHLAYIYEQILFQSVHIRSMLLLHLAYIFQTLWTNSLPECTHTIHASFTYGLYFSNFMNKFSFRVYTYDPCFFYIWLIFFKLYEQILFKSVHIRSMLLLHLAYIFQTLWTNSLSECTHTIHASFTFGLYFSNFMNKFSFRVYTYDPCFFYIWLIFFKLYEQILFQSVHIRSMLLLHLAYIFQTLWTNSLSECTHTIHASFTFGLYFSNFMNKFSFRVYTYDPCFFYIWLIFFKLCEQILFQSVHIRSMLLLHLAYIFQTLWTNSLSECTHTIHASFTFGSWLGAFHTFISIYRH